MIWPFNEPWYWIALLFAVPLFLFIGFVLFEDTTNHTDEG